jgi:O-antigen/teichoic acid export membrane protein
MDYVDVNAVKKLQARHVFELAWVIGGQASTALGTVIGVRLLTQFVSPPVYGLVSLALGVSTLAINLGCTPFAQAAMHFYSAAAIHGTLSSLRQAIIHCIRRVAIWVLTPLVIGAFVYCFIAHGFNALGFILAAFVISDSCKTLGLSILNSARRQRRYALWAASDAWLKPILATVAVIAIGQSADSILTAYFGASVALVLLFQREICLKGIRTGPRRAESLDDSVSVFEIGVWRYAASLIPLALISWAVNLGDRYVIGGVLGLRDAGVYAAVYGLSSAPVMILGGTIEQAMRPIHQHAVSAGEHTRANALFLLWLAAVTVGCTICAIAIDRWRDFLATLFLGHDYRSAADLMPWIAAGYTVRSVAYVFERVCYAYGRTRRVLAIQCFTAAATFIATPIAVLGWGLEGAAVAVPIYFGVELIAAGLLSATLLRVTTEYL